MSTPLPPDPYRALGVSKKADAADIKTAYRKLVLKCHPDKVQDAALKAIKQDEFTKVHQAWEILGDRDKRRHYDAQVELHDLKREMGKNGPSPGSNAFAFDVRRRTSTKPNTRESPKVSSQRPRKSFEDVIYDMPQSSQPRRTASYEIKRDRPSTRDGERERQRDRERERDRRKAAAAAEEEKIRAKFEKEMEKQLRHEKKKGRHRDRFEKIHTRSAYVEDDTDEDLRAQAKIVEQKHRRAERGAEAAKEAARANMLRKDSLTQGILTPKWDGHMAQAAEYMQQSRRKAPPKVEDEFRPNMVRRAETFAAAPTASFDARYPVKSSDEESPRRAAARASRRTSETPSKPRVSRDSPKILSKEKKFRAEPPHIVEFPPKPPNLHPQTSAPPLIFAKPNRSKTSEYPRAEGIPSLSRSATFASGDRARGYQNPKPKTPVEYADSTSSESDEAPYPTPRQSRSPPLRHATPETRYIIDNGRSVPISKHRASEVFDHDPYAQTRARSPSPPARRSTEHPRMSQRAPSSARPPPAASSYFPPEITDPAPSRPKMNRESSRTASHRSPYQFADVLYAPKITPDNVVYSAVPEYRREAGQPSSHYTYGNRTGRGGEVYAS